MGLIYCKNTKSGSKVGIWKITETESQLKDKLKHLEDIPTVQNHRTMQWLAARVLLMELCEKEVLIEKDKFGKPHLPQEDLKISITHCGDFAAAIISENEGAGIDLEKVNPRILRVGHKFAVGEEKEILDKHKPEMALHIIWGVKESLYKLYGRKEIDFIQHLKIIEEKENVIVSSINKGAFSVQVEMEYEMFNEMLLVHTL